MTNQAEDHPESVTKERLIELGYEVRPPDYWDWMASTPPLDPESRRRGLLGTSSTEEGAWEKCRRHYLSRQRVDRGIV
jgi:hypothetical protein